LFEFAGCGIFDVKFECVNIIVYIKIIIDRFYGLVVGVLGYRSGGPGSIPGTTKKK
jgi:hypothetical protein